MRVNALLGTGLVGALLGMAAVATVWTPYNPVAVRVRERLLAPSGAHWLGTDEFGRDVASRVMAGAATSVGVSVTTVVCAVLMGVAVGVLAGTLRGWTDRVLMAVSDALLAFPGILLALAVLSVVGGGSFGIVAALTVAYTPTVARVVRAAVLAVAARDYVEASRVSGNSALYTMARHVLPNCTAPIIVLATAMLGWVLLAESALSFLGLGVPPPAPSWGTMLAASRPYMQTAVWLELAPGLCIALALLGVNMLGDALRDRFDPRLQTGR